MCFQPTVSSRGRTTPWATAGWTRPACSAPACTPSASAAARRERSRRLPSFLQALKVKHASPPPPTSQGAPAGGFPRVVPGARGACHLHGVPGPDGGPTSSLLPRRDPGPRPGFGPAPAAAADPGVEPPLQCSSLCDNKAP